jgi:hypothetical protein
MALSVAGNAADTCQMKRNLKIAIAAIAGGTTFVLLSIVAISFGLQAPAPEEVPASSRSAESVARTTEIGLADGESSQPAPPSAPAVVAPPPPAPAFAIKCSPDFQPDEDNHGVTSCTVASTGGFAEPVQLSCTGPAGVVRCRTTPDIVTPAPNGSVKFRLDANTTQEVRSYVLVVTGTSGALNVTHKATMRLDYLGPDGLAPPPPPPLPAGATIAVTCAPTSGIHPPFLTTASPPVNTSCFIKQLTAVAGEAQLSVTSSVPGVYVKPSMPVPGPNPSPLGDFLPFTIVPAEAGAGTHTLQITATLGGYSSSSSQTFTIT